MQFVISINISYKLKFMKKVRHWFFSCTNATMISGKKKQIKQKLRRGNLKKMCCVFHFYLLEGTNRDVTVQLDFIILRRQ